MDNYYLVICTPFIDEAYADVQPLTIDRLYFSTNSDIIFISEFEKISDRVQELFPKKKIIIRIKEGR